MVDPLVHHHEFGEPWTIDDLKDLPDDATGRYEIYDGSLVVTPYAWRTDKPFPLAFDLAEIF